MSELFNLEAVRQKLAALPIETYQASDTVLAEGSTTGDVLVLNAGAVEVVRTAFGSARSRSPVQFSASCRRYWANRTRRTSGRWSARLSMSEKPPAFCAPMPISRSTWRRSWPGA